MTYHLASFRLRSIGERSARFTDLTLNTTIPRGGILQPADTVLWLRNGGGKSSLLSLFYALLLPRAVDFMGRAVKRALTDYIDAGDTSHTIAVWHRTSDTTTLTGEPEQILCTGAVYEWADLRRPADADKARDRLHADYYAFYAVPGVLDPTNLPFEDAKGEPLRRNDFLAGLRQRAEQHPQALELIITDKQHQWQSELVNRGLDPDVFRTQKEMNHVEGGVEDLFRFPTSRAFIDFLIDLTVPPETASSVAERLSAIADVLASKPGLIAERDFCIDMVSALEPVHQALLEVGSARGDADLASKEAVDLAAAFAATVRAGETAGAQLTRDRHPFQQRVSQLNTEVAIANDLAYLYRLAAAELREVAAEQVHEDAIRAAEIAVHDAAAWEATESLHEKAELSAAIERTRDEMVTEREQVRPYIVEHDEHAARLRQRLILLADNQHDEAEGHDVVAAGFRMAAADHDEAARKAAQTARTADNVATAAATRLTTLQEDLAKAERESLLPSIGTDPAEHAETVRERFDRDQRALETVQHRRLARPMERTVLTSALTDLTTECTSLDNERTRVQGEHEALQGRITAFSSHPRVRDLIEADEQVPADLWAEGDTLTRRLTDEVRQADEDLVRQEASRLEDQRLLDTQVRTGVLPTSSDAETVRQALIEAGIDATSGWTYLRQNTPASRLAAALTDPDIARLGCGVIVPSDQAEDSAAALRRLDITTIALVGVYTVADADQLAKGGGVQVQPAWSGLSEGLVIEAAAAGAAVRAAARQTEYENRRQIVVAQRNVDRTLLQDFGAFLLDYPAGRVDSLSRRIADLDTTLLKAHQMLSQTNDALAAMAVADEQDRIEERRLLNSVHAIEQTLSRLNELAARTSQAVAWRSEREIAEKASAEARAASGDATAAAQAARDSANESANRATTARESAKAHRSARAKVTFLEADPGPVEDDESATLELLASRRDAALRSHEIRVAASVLEERLRNDRSRLSKVEVMLTQTSQDVLTTAEDYLRRPEAQTDESRQTARLSAQTARSAAERKQGRTEEAVAAAKGQVKEIRARRSDLPTRRLPLRPAAAADADGLAAEQEFASQSIREELAELDSKIQRLDKQQQIVEARTKDFRHLLDDLPEPSGPAGQPYAGNEDEAREERRQIIQALNEVRQRQQDAQTGLVKTIAKLRSGASAQRYVGVTITAKDRILHDADESIAAKAQELARNLKVRAATIDGQLADIESDQAVVAKGLAHLVTRTLDTLRKAERFSMLPKTLGAWAGKLMLTIGFDAPPTDGDLMAYVNRVIDRRIGEGVKAEGLPLLKEAVHESVGPRGFKVKVLKPTEDVTSTREDITRLGKWSGGEKLTVCVALYCTIAALRSASSPRRDRSGGVLLLDNPIGRASHGSLVMLQRRVAEAHGVQLIYTTGVKDPDAVSRFPNVVRLDNRAGRTRNRRYIVENPTPPKPEHAGNQVFGVRIAHDQSTADSDEDQNQ